MCDCKEKIEARLLERFKTQQPDAQEVSISINGYALIFGETLESKPYLPIDGTYKLPMKNGGMKSKKLKDSMIANYCPFCGISLKAKPEAEAA